ncbi:MAG: DUF4157 domain-containing protein, partial [Bryobacteraceae bacterium]
MLQAKLEINQPGDAYEQEADRVADQVMVSVLASPDLRADAPLGVQRKCALCAISGSRCPKCDAEEKEAALQRKEAASAPLAIPSSVHEVSNSPVEGRARQMIGATLRRERTGAAASGVVSQQRAAPAIVHDVLNAPGQPLKPETRALYESRFGFDFSGVRVHADAEAAESASVLNARAYTVGRHLVFANRQYAPEANAGKWLLAHELAHVVQQNAAVEIANPTGAPPNGVHERHEDRAALQRESDAPLTRAFALDRGIPVQLQRQVEIPGQTVREPDPGCPPEKPYRIAPKAPPGPADYAVVPVCSATPIPSTPTPTNP